MAQPRNVQPACHHCAHRDPGRLSARDLILIDLFLAGRMPLDRLIARYDFADFNRAGATPFPALR
jgi:hypothetical protein